LQAADQIPIMMVQVLGRRGTLAKAGESMLGNAAGGGTVWPSGPGAIGAALSEASIPQTKTLEDNEYE